MSENRDGDSMFPVILVGTFWLAVVVALTMGAGVAVMAVALVGAAMVLVRPIIQTSDNQPSQLDFGAAMDHIQKRSGDPSGRVPPEQSRRAA